MAKKIEILRTLVCVIATFLGMAILGFNPNTAKAYNGVSTLTKNKIQKEE